MLPPDEAPRTPDAPSGRDERSGRLAPWQLAALAAIAVGALAVRLIGFTDPFGDHSDLHTIFGTACTGGRARALADHGILEARLMPYDWRVEYDDGGLHRPYYTHHPPLYMFLVAWSIELFGPTEAAVRAVPLVFSMLALWAIFLLARALVGTRLALVALLLAALYPLGARAGMITWTEAPIAAFIAFAARRHLFWLRGGGRRHIRAAAVWIAVGGLFDWPMAFAAGALFLHGWVFARGPLRADRNLLWLLPLASVVTVALHRVHMALILPHDVAQAEKQTTLSNAMTLQLPLEEFLAIQWQFLVKQLTPWGAGLCLFGVVVTVVTLIRRRPAAETWLVAALLVPGLLYVGLFPGRSHNHDFFLVVSLAWFALTGALALGALTGPRTGGVARIVRFAAAAVLVGLFARHALIQVTAETLVRRAAAERFTEILEQPRIAELLADPDAVVMTHFGRGQLLLLYSHAPVVWAIDHVDLFELLLDEFRARIAPPRRLVYLVEFESMDLNPQLAPLQERLARFGPPEIVLTRGGHPYALVDLRGGDL